MSGRASHAQPFFAPRLCISAGLLLFAIAFGAGDAHAIVKGRESSLGFHVVRVSGRGGAQCSGVAIGRSLVVTAAHCGGRSVRTSSGSIGVRAITRSAVLDDGRSASVSGDAAILKLAAPLPPSISPVSVGEGSGDMYTIAGYGAVEERYRGSMGTLHEASLMPAGRYNLIDYTRDSSISASACFGDSGGPVLRGLELVGVISRAAHPSPRIACGHITRWAPIMVSGAAKVADASSIGAETEMKIEPAKPVRHKRKYQHRYH